MLWWASGVPAGQDSVISVHTRSVGVRRTGSVLAATVSTAAGARYAIAHDTPLLWLWVERVSVVIGALFAALVVVGKLRSGVRRHTWMLRLSFSATTASGAALLLTGPTGTR